MAAVNQNKQASGKKHCQVLLAVLILLIYCASNILDYDSGSFEVKSKSATPPPKKQQPYYPIEPGKIFYHISRLGQNFVETHLKSYIYLISYNIFWFFLSI